MRSSSRPLYWNLVVDFVNRIGLPDLQVHHLNLTTIGYQLPVCLRYLEGYNKIAHKSSYMPPMPSLPQVPTPITFCRLRQSDISNELTR